MADGTNVIVTQGSGVNVTVVDVDPNFIITDAASFTADPNTFYELTRASLQTITLPSSPTDGSVIGFGGVGAGLFRISQVAGEQILFGTTPTTVGATGYVESTQINCVIYLRYISAPGVWLAYNMQGVFDIDGTDFNNAINAIPNTTTISHGQASKNFTTDTQALTNSVWTRFNSGTFTSNELSNFTHTDGRLTYTGTPTNTFKVDFLLSIPQGAASANFETGIGLNGTIIDNSRNQIRNTSTPSVFGAAATLVSLSTNDYVEPFVRCTGFNATISATSAIIIAHQISGSQTVFS